MDKKRNKVRVTHWIPDFTRLSLVFEPFDMLQDAFKSFAQWPAVEDLEVLMHTAVGPVTCSDKPLRFVPQSISAKELSQQYEPRIFLTGEVQTRENNWHDFFNALVWMTFPRSKAVLNQIHFNELQRVQQNNQKQRGSLRDAATLFDESGVIVVCSDEALIDLLRNHEWKQLFWQQREAVLSSMRFFVFGHGLYEKALAPYIGMTGKGVVIHVEQAFLKLPLSTQLSVVDTMLEQVLSQSEFTSADLTPIPILGYPGWLSDNDCQKFYDNEQYFRLHPSRRKL